MMQRFSSIFAVIFVVLVLSVSLISAQSSACAELVESALKLVQDSCSTIGRNSICYGHGNLEALTSDNTPLPDFAQPGDTESVLNLSSLSTSAMNIDDGLWGVAMLALQANLPDTLPGQNVTFVLFGSSDLEAVEQAGFDAPFQAFQFSTGIGKPVCEEAPDDGLLIQAPQDTTVNFLINGIEVEVGSTVYVQEDGGELTFSTFEGTVRVTSGDETQTVEPGYSVTVSTDEAPTEPEPYTYDDAVKAPVNLLPNSIIIPVVVPGDKLDGWVETPIMVEEGQAYRIVAVGTVNVFNDCEEMKAQGEIASDYLCNLMVVGPDSQLGPPTDAPDPDAYPSVEASVGALLGRVGDGDTIIMGDGGVFTAEHAGNLQFRVNDDNLRQDNSGAFIVFVILLPK